MGVRKISASALPQVAPDAARAFASKGWAGKGVGLASPHRVSIGCSRPQPQTVTDAAWKATEGSGVSRGAVPCGTRCGVGRCLLARGSWGAPQAIPLSPFAAAVHMRGLNRLDWHIQAAQGVLMVNTSRGPSGSNMRYHALKADRGGFAGPLPE